VLDVSIAGGRQNRVVRLGVLARLVPPGRAGLRAVFISWRGENGSDFVVESSSFRVSAETMIVGIKDGTSKAGGPVLYVRLSSPEGTIEVKLDRVAYSDLKVNDFVKVDAVVRQFQGRLYLGDPVVRLLGRMEFVPSSKDEAGAVVKRAGAEPTAPAERAKAKFAV